MLLTLFVGITSIFNAAYAQRYLPKQKGIQITAGMSDGVHWDKKTDFAYYFGTSFSVYTKRGNRWIVGMEYYNKKYPYKTIKIPVNQYTAEGGYYLNFLSDRKKIFFLSVGLSGMLGCEISNNGEKLLYDGATLNNKDVFVYGGAATLEVEIYIIDRLVLLIGMRERLLFGSTIGKFHTQVGTGLKFIIN